MWCLVNTTFNGKKFSFSARDVDSVMKYFDYQFVMNMYVYNRGSNVIFDTGICNYECSQWSI